MFTSIMFIVLCVHKTHSDIDFILDNPCIADMMFLHEFHKYEDSSSNVTFLLTETLSIWFLLPIGSILELLMALRRMPTGHQQL